NPQAAIMNKVMLYLFPIGVVVGGPFFPLAILIYWLSNNAWTLGQQYVIYRQIDAEEQEKKQEVITRRSSSAPRPGQKPAPRPKRGATPPIGSSGPIGTSGEVGRSGSSNGSSTHPGEGNSSTDGAENGAVPGMVQPRTRGKKTKKRR
ncbi:MAG: YidC/Oxa1 family membrane protein insertase, partial [Actinomycetota bacterium]|nr:YidC/Oxa1 family membrane protein insertase [Actinomycetota bacterium]